MPIEDLIGSYDIITIDHPYMGQAHFDQLLLPLEQYIPKRRIVDLLGQSVGPSFRSYAYEGHQYALPVDAAALVAAYRKDLVHDLKLEIPKTREELFNFYTRVPDGHKVAWPLCPTDLWCTFLTLCAQDGGREVVRDRSIDKKVGVRVLDELKRHMEFLHPGSINWNPIQVLDRMGEDDEIIYAPFLFGYTNYARTGYAKNRVDFVNSPINPSTDVSTLLGGVGLSISVYCQHCDLAAAYIDYVAGAEIQEGIYTQNGGQPANLIAWQSKANNLLCNHFFNNTLSTLENAYVRPRHRGWNIFQEKGSDILHKGFRNATSSEEMIRNLNQFYKSIA